MTGYSKLLEERKIRKGRFGPGQVEACLKIAERDIETARTVLETSPEWAFNIAYNAMHQAGRAYMFAAGYRAAGEHRHAVVVQFLEIGLGQDYSDVLAIMDRMRRKRNRATYDMTGTISRKEAGEAIEAAACFVAAVKRELKPEGGT